jgi:hypothetical protein
MQSRTMPDHPQYVRALVKAWTEGDDHAGHVLRFISSTPEEQAAIRRKMILEALGERPDR